MVVVLGVTSSCMLDIRAAAASEASLLCVVSGSVVTAVVVAAGAGLVRRLVRETG